MTKAIETLSGADATAFRAAVLAAIDPEANQLADHETRVDLLEATSGSAEAAAAAATTQAGLADTARVAAEAARDATLASFDSFDDRYLGAKASDPALDNDGNALATGALYYNTVSLEFRVWPGTAPWASFVGGTVTSVAALTLGTAGTDVTSSVADPTTTPVITLNIPTASAANRGALSAADWAAFNAKQAALVSGTNIKTFNGSSILGSGDLVVGGGTVVKLTSDFTTTSATAVDTGLSFTPAVSKRYRVEVLMLVKVSASQLLFGVSWPTGLTSGTGRIEFDGGTINGSFGTNQGSSVPVSNAANPVLISGVNLGSVYRLARAVIILDAGASPSGALKIQVATAAGATGTVGAGSHLVATEIV